MSDSADTASPFFLCLSCETGERTNSPKEMWYLLSRNRNWADKRPGDFGGFMMDTNERKVTEDSLFCFMILLEWKGRVPGSPQTLFFSSDDVTRYKSTIESIGRGEQWEGWAVKRSQKNERSDTENNRKAYVSSEKSCLRYEMGRDLPSEKSCLLSAIRDRTG